MPGRAVPQRVSAPLSRAAVFLVVTVNPDPDSRAAVRSFCADLSGLIRAVDFRDTDRILDFSRAVTGTLFFVPSATFLDAVSDDAPATMAAASAVAPPLGRNR